MTKTPEIDRAFTDEEMGRIHRIVDQAPSVANVIVFVHNLLIADHGLTLMKDFGQGEFDPTKMRIPSTQWEQIAQWCMDRWGSAVALSFMNSGPSVSNND